YMPRARWLGAAAISAAILALLSLTTMAAASGAPGPLGPRHDGLRPQAVLPSLLPNSAENTNVIVQNNGGSNATIAVDIYTPSGVLVTKASQVQLNVPPGASRTFSQATNTGLVIGFRGVSRVSRGQPVIALMNRDFIENGTFRHAYSIHNIASTGSSKVTLPYIANNLNGIYQTKFS